MASFLTTISIKSYLKRFDKLPLISGHIANDIGGNLYEIIKRFDVLEDGFEEVWQPDLIELNLREKMKIISDSDLDKISVQIEKFGMDNKKLAGEGFFHAHRLMGAYLRSLRNWNERENLYIAKYNDLPGLMRETASRLVIVMEAHHYAH